MTHQIFDVSWGRCTLHECIDPCGSDFKSHIKSFIKLQVHGFFWQKHGWFQWQKKKTKRRKHYFFEMRKSAKSLWEFEVGRKHASVGPKKVVDAGQNQ